MLWHTSERPLGIRGGRPRRRVLCGEDGRVVQHLVLVHACMQMCFTKLERRSTWSWPVLVMIVRVLVVLVLMIVRR